MKVAIVGLGYWGPNLVRNFLSSKNVEKVVCFDIQQSKIDRMKKKFPEIEVEQSFEQLLQRKDIEAVAIATPVSTHFPLGMQVLRAGKHLLLEKPMAATVKEAEDLASFADKEGLKISIDHTFIYTDAIQKIKELVNNDVVGDILYFDSVRINLGLFQHDTNVIWDLAPHDVSIMYYLVNGVPSKVSAIGAQHFNGFHDMAYITVQYNKSLIAHFHVNWLSPVKIRRVLIGGSKHMVLYDDMNPSEKVKVYDKGVEVNDEESLHHALVQYRLGDMFVPRIDEKEALSVMIDDFISSIENDSHSISNAQFGVNVVRILEAADTSAKRGGISISIES
ncbi:MAG TPA: Gfo/Idh/MocA family oxidoreductase [Bacteroidota bacterium]|nr:Gfo/Idh/MocA family oxidoreductase [Bacteroidota bacterium]